MTRPAATDPSTAKYIRMWCRTNVRPPSHQRLSSHSVPMKRASLAQRNSAPNPDSRFTLEITLGTRSRVSRNTKAPGRMRRRRLTASASANAATSAPMVTIWMRERGSGMMVSAPAEPSVLRTSNPQTIPTIFAAPAGRDSARGCVSAVTGPPGSSLLLRLSPISTTRP